MHDVMENVLSSIESLHDIIQQSTENPEKVVVIFKHSTRCSISQMALNRMQKTSFFKEKNIPFYYLDLISYRNVSDGIAEKFQVEHESPQILVIKNAKCLASVSHNGISENWLLGNI